MDGICRQGDVEVDVKAGGKDLRIVLLGKTGVGKSSVGNTILGIDDKFTAECSVNSATHNCKRAEKNINGRNIVVIDTPGIFDTDRSEEELRKEIISCLVECAPGPHVFIVVLKVERHTQENQKALENLLEYFTDSIYPHMILLFTHGDDLDENMNIQHFIHQPDGEKNMSGKCNLEDFTKKAGDRVHVIDNKHWNENSIDSALIERLKQLNYTEQAIRELTEKMKSTPAERPEKTPWFDVLSEQSHNVETKHQNVSDKQRMKEYRTNKYQLTQLMKSIKNILRENEEKHYSNEALVETEKAINEEVANIMHETEHESERVDTVEIRREARERVRTKLGEKLSGVAVGILLGALLGVGVGVLAPFVLVAGGIRKIWNMASHQHPQAGGPRVHPADAGAGAAAGAGVVAGAIAELGVLAAGAATGIGAAVGAGVLLIYGAAKGGACGCEVAETASNPKEAADKAAKAVTQKAGDVLKSCLNLGKTETGPEYEPLNNSD